MAKLKLYIVTAGEVDWDTFAAAVVYAHDEADAIELVRAEQAKVFKDAEGSWYERVLGGLTAKPVPYERGAILGHSVSG